MRDQTKNVEKNAREAIFTELPQLYLNIQRIIDTNEYFQENAVINFYTKLETLFFDLHDTAISHDILKQQFKNSDELLNQAAKINLEIYNLIQVIQVPVDQTQQILDKIITWLQVLLPKKVSGGHSAQEESLQQLTKDVENQIEELQQFFEIITTYYTKRAQIIKNLRKQPCYDLYRYLIQLECNQLRQITEYIISLNIKLLSFYRGLSYNYESFRKIDISFKQSENYLQ